ncbi:hypothetical protein [Halobacillus seohaensis]|uniref:Uncharacterized protein n=1 Tax=Halobacillus seohaensis TaxID=447421 RepID=A0ABW2ESK4_9BACI
MGRRKNRKEMRSPRDDRRSKKLNGGKSWAEKMMKTIEESEKGESSNENQ